MDNLSSAIHMLRKHFKNLSQNNDFEKSFRAGYGRALKELTWLKEQVEEEEEKKIEDYLKNGITTTKLKLKNMHDDVQEV
ncbi:MAG: hypothetical protein SOY42_05945 [Clostridium sp.]|nr:hypothetical protein [Clostridium sp.]